MRRAASLRAAQLGCAQLTGPPSPTPRLPGRPRFLNHGVLPSLPLRIPARSSMPCNLKGLHTHLGHAYSVWLLSCSLETSRCRHVPEGLDVLAATCSALNFAVLALALLYKRCQHRARSRTSAERREVAQLERVSTAGTREPGQSTGSSEFALLERSSFSRDGTRERVLAAGAEEAGYGQAKGCVVKLAQFPRPSCR